MAVDSTVGQPHPWKGLKLKDFSKLTNYKDRAWTNMFTNFDVLTLWLTLISNGHMLVVLPVAPSALTHCGVGRESIIEMQTPGNQRWVQPRHLAFMFFIFIRFNLRHLSRAQRDLRKRHGKEKTIPKQNSFKLIASVRQGTPDEAWGWGNDMVISQLSHAYVECNSDVITY
jgi:hypothetical protein